MWLCGLWLYQKVDSAISVEFDRRFHVDVLNGHGVLASVSCPLGPPARETP
jgi:hypothetical protein